MTEHFYGWIKDKFNMAAVYHEPVVKVLPASTNNRIYFPTVQNQDGVGACGGFAWAEHINSVCKQIGQPVDRFSENWIYNGARYLEGTLLQDAGLANDDAITWLTEHGFLQYPYWPFADVLDKAAPSSLRESEANFYPNLKSFRVDNGVDGLKSAMADGHTMVVGAPWFAQWEDYSSGVLPVPTVNSPVAGGHDTEWADYDDSVQAFYCQNSWDVPWGIQGHFWLPYAAIDIFKQLGGYDAHYLTFDPLGTPPVPTNATINISVTPANAAIYLDGNFIPGQPKSFTVDPGTYIFKASAKGYKSAQQTKTVQAGQIYPVVFNLQKSGLCIFN